MSKTDKKKCLKCGNFMDTKRKDARQCRACRRRQQDEKSYEILRGKRMLEKKIREVDKREKIIQKSLDEANNSKSLLNNLRRRKSISADELTTQEMDFDWKKHKMRKEFNLDKKKNKEILKEALKETRLSD